MALDRLGLPCVNIAVCGKYHFTDSPSARNSFKGVKHGLNHFFNLGAVANNRILGGRFFLRLLGGYKESFNAGPYIINWFFA